MNAEADPTTPQRVKSFAIFFKNYMSISSVLVAALPIPVIQWKLIPVYAGQRNYLSVWTSLFCFLLLGFVFFCRRSLALHMFPEIVAKRRRLTEDQASVVEDNASVLAATPLLLIFVSLLSVFCYHSCVNDAVEVSQAHSLALAHLDDVSSKEFLSKTTYAQANGAEDFVHQSAFKDIPARDEVLSDAKSVNPHETALSWWYLLIFLTAETAFLLMAIREYIQDVLKVSDADLILGQAKVAGE